MTRNLANRFQNVISKNFCVVFQFFKKYIENRGKNK